MRISVCMIVRDEEKRIADTLSCIPSDYEIVVLDTGSVDRTREIARSFGARVYDFRGVTISQSLEIQLVLTLMAIIS
ncbi:hypothetical protein HMSSN139_45950 [Paenibacillus sp. HMSSN-139]|nr:hypothetical protein HMSSN139_45950 [Paenibacillus sp. HMSSN-139]